MRRRARRNTRWQARRTDRRSPSSSRARSRAQPSRSVTSSALGRPPRKELAKEESRANDRARQAAAGRTRERARNRAVCESPHFSAIDVDEIRDALERVKADADRNEEIDEPRIRRACPASAATVLLAKFAYLKVPRKREIRGDAEREQQRGFCCGSGMRASLQGNRNEEIAGRQDPEEDDIPCVPARVEIVTREEQHKTAESAVAADRTARRRSQGTARTRTIEIATESRCPPLRQTTKASDACALCHAKRDARRAVLRARAFGTLLSDDTVGAFLQITEQCGLRHRKGG